MSDCYVITDGDGAVLGFGRCPQGEAIRLPQLDEAHICALVSEEVLAEVRMGPQRFRLLGGEIIPRQVMAPTLSAASIVADGVAEVVISGLPDPCTVTVTGVATLGPLEVTGGELRLTAEVAGELRVRVVAGVSWAPWMGCITATPSLATLRAAALLQVDAAAGAARMRWITYAPGQDMEYMATEAEARRYVAAGTGTPAEYPMLWAEAQAIGSTATLATVAAEVIALTDAWTAAGAEIKRLRRTAKLAIEAATSPAEIEAATAVTWPPGPAGG